MTTLSYTELVRITWPLLVASTLLSMHGDIDYRFTTPFFYTRVHCCEGTETLPDVITFGGRILNLSISSESCDCDLASTYGRDAIGHDGRIAACAVPQIDPSHPLWSHSEFCPNWPYVREETQLLMTRWIAFSAVVSLFCIPSAGSIADLYGRLHIFLWSSCLYVAVCMQ